MDAFYVSCELQRRPELRGKPVVVAGSGPRAVVTTASYEARKFGVFSATPASRARRVCPQAIFVAPDFTHYRERSREVMEVLHEQVDTVEVVGLDEAYLDLTGFERPNAAGRRIKAAVTERTGLACSIGIGPSKLVAKVASDADKPDGFLSLTAEEARERFGGASPRLVPGIGPKTAERLEARGVAAARPARRDGRRAAVGAVRARAWAPTSAAWRGSRTSASSRPSACASRSRRRPPSTATCTAWSRWSRELARLADQLCDDLERNGRSGRTVRLKVRLDDFSIHTRARTLPAAVSDAETIGSVARELLRKLDPQRPVRLLGVGVAGMEGAARAGRPAPAARLTRRGSFGSMSEDRLTALDASFLHLEDASSHMHVASVMLFEGDPPPYDELLESIDRRLHLVPRYRQKLAYVPLGQGRPRWVDDPHLNLRYHVRSTALPSPGCEEQLRNLAGRVFAQQLDRDKPLWEIWLVEGLEDGGFAMLSKTHHALVDGISGVDIVTVLFDTSPEPAAPPDPGQRWLPRPLPSGAQLLGEALVERATVPGELARTVRAVFRGPRAGGQQRGERRRRRRRHGLGRAQPRARQPLQRGHRPAPPLHLGARRPRRREGDQERAGRHRERRGAGLGRRARWGATCAAAASPPTASS